MYVYKLSRTDDIGYDEYDAHVITSDVKLTSIEQATKIVQEANNQDDIWYRYNPVVKLEEITSPQLVLSSFNAG